MSGVAPYVIGGGAVLAVSVRVLRYRRRRARAAAEGAGSGAGGMAGAPSPGPAPGRPERIALGDTGLIAAREIRERLRGRFFKVITLVLLAVVAAAIVIPSIHSTKTTRPVDVGVVGTLPGAARQAITVEAKRAGHPVRLVNEPGLGRARAGLSDGRLTVVVATSATVLVDTSSAAKGTTTTGQIAQTIAEVVGFYDTVASAGLTPAQASAVARSKALPVKSVQPAPHNSSGGTTSVIGLILTFIMLTQYLGWTLMGVLEEKTSRVVEVLLATVRPVQLLGGKVLGIGAVALAQAAVVVAFALVLAGAVGSDLLHGTGPAVVFSTLLWLVLGYAFYSWVYAAAGSMAARQDQVQSLALPLSIPLIVGYVVALTSVSRSSPSGLITVFAYLPPTAPFGMPVLIGYGAAAWWEVALSALLMVASTVLVARVAAGVYRRAVLRTGRRVTFREVLATGR